MVLSLVLCVQRGLFQSHANILLILLYDQTTGQEPSLSVRLIDSCMNMILCISD